MRIDQVMLGDMVSNEEVGIYSAAVRIAEVWYFIPMSIVSSVFPSIIDIKKANEILYIDRLQKLYTLMTWLGISVAVPMTFFPDVVISLLYGENYKGAENILSISTWAGIFVAQGVARGKWMIVENLQKYTFWYVGGAAILNIILNFFLIPVYKAQGAAVATIISYFFSVIIFPLLINKTRSSAVQLIKSFNILYLYRAAKNV